MLLGSRPQKARPALPLALLVCVDCSLTLCLNFFNSHLLKRVPFPLTYAWLTFTTAFLGTLVLAWQTGTRASWSQAQQHMGSLAALATLKAAASVLSNVSLQHLELSVYKVLLLTGPCFVVCIGALLQRSVAGLSRPKLLALLALGCGAALTCASIQPLGPRTLMGIGLALCSTGVGAAGVVLSGLLLAGGEMAPLALLLYLSPTQAALVACVLPFTEAAPFAAWARSQGVVACSRIVAGALLSFCLQLATFTVVQRTSAPTASMLGNLKSLLTIGLAVTLLGAHVSTACALGYVSSVMAGALYTVAALRDAACDGAASAEAQADSSDARSDDSSRTSEVGAALPPTPGSGNRHA